jgi:hypothetical protein
MTTVATPARPNFVDGAFLEGGRLFDVISPVDGHVVGVAHEVCVAL